MFRQKLIKIKKCNQNRIIKNSRFDALELGADSTKKISLTPNTTRDTLELKLTEAGKDTNVRIHGVANGTGNNDAVNKEQLGFSGKCDTYFQ